LYLKEFKLVNVTTNQFVKETKMAGSYFLFWLTARVRLYDSF